MSQDTFIVMRTYGAAAAVEAAGEEVRRGEISPASEQRIVEAARLQSGKIDPQAVTVMENLAKQLGRVATSLRTKHAEESKPRSNLADYPLTPQDLQKILVTGYELEKNMAEVLSFAVRQEHPLSMSDQVTLLGGKKCEDGSYEAIVVVHQFMTEPTDQDPRFRVKSDGKGGAATVTPVKAD